ncbi:MAG: PLD nuclease N-terminal domain-containing protein [Angustibacter sp.]
MVRLYGILAIVQLALLVYCLLDCLRAESARVRTLPKLAWMVFIVLLPLAGSIGWLWLGRPRPSRGRGDHGRSRETPRGPDDDPDFLRGLGRS